MNNMQTVLIRKSHQPLNKLALVGDSVIGCICANNVDVIAMHGARPDDVKKALYKYDLRQYRAVAICVGGNALSSFREREALSPKCVADEIHKLAKYIGLSARVYVFGIIKRNQPKNINDKIAELNAELLEVYKHSFIPVSKLSVGDICIDKIHLQKSGAAHFISKVLPRFINGNC